MPLATTCCCVDPDPGVSGGCCLEDGSCVNVGGDDEGQLIDACEGTLGGTFQGLGTDCATLTCPEPPDPRVCTACCFPDGSCFDSCGPTIFFANGRCVALGGVPQGEGTECATTDCPVPEEVGACCSGCICSEPTTEAECNALPDSTWYGPNSFCATTVCLVCQHDNPGVSLPIDGSFNFGVSLEDAYGNNYQAMLDWLNDPHSLPLVVNGCEIPGFPSCTFRLSREWPNTRWGGVIRAILEAREIASNRWQVQGFTGTFAFAQTFESSGFYESPAAANDNFSEPATATFVSSGGNPLFVGGSVSIN